MSRTSKQLSTGLRAKRQRGMSLVELMVAITISAMLLAGTISVFVGNKRISREINETGLLQENGRFALQYLFEAIRMSGHVGCSDDPLRLNNGLKDIPGTGVLMDMQNMVEGFEAGQASWAPSAGTEVVTSLPNPPFTGTTSPSSGTALTVTNLEPGTDALTLRYIRGTGFPLNSDMGVEADSINIAINTTGFGVGDIVAVHDCGGADVFKITGIDSTTDPTEDRYQHAIGGATGDNLTADLSRIYGQSATLARLVARRFFVLDHPITGEPSLFREDGVPIIEGVEDMQILYGEDTSADSVVDTFVTADAVTNWNNVISVRIGLLIRTLDPNPNLVGTSSPTYNVLGNVRGPFTDGYRRRVFTTTVLIRNRDV